MAVLRDENGADTDGTQWRHICFHIFYGSGNKYGNPGNKYKNKYCRKQIQTEYGTDSEHKANIYGTKRPVESCRKTPVKQQTYQFYKMKSHIRNLLI